MEEWIRALPKVELHCHLDGSLPIDAVRSVLEREVAETDLRAEPDCKDLIQYLTRFSLPLSCMQTREDIRKVSEAFLQEVSKENVRYIETRFAPLSSVNETLDTRTVIESVLEGLTSARQQCGTEFGVILCAMRHQSDEENLAMFKAGREFLGEGVVAADLAGDEASFPMERFMDLFTTVKAMDYPITIHAGEQGRVENVLLAAEVGASRVGHGIAMTGHTDVQRIVRDKHVGVEMCPVSNLQTHAVDTPSAYPLREFLDAGLLVSINTDNRTVSGTTLTNDLATVAEWCGLTRDDIVQLQMNAIETSFAGDTVKDRLFRLYR